MNRPRFSKIQIVVVAILCAAVAAAVFLPSRAPATISLDAEEAEMCRLINNYRASKGLGPLLVSEKLTAAADWYSTDMATKDYVNADHTDSLGRTVKQRIVAFGYDYSTTYAENIAWGRSGASGTFTGWQNSAIHNTNMLTAGFKVIGIGRATNAGSEFGTYWTTDFGGFVDPNAIPCPGSATPTPTPSPTATAAGPALSVGDVSTLEGNSTSGETKLIKFTVSIPKASNKTIRVSYSTSDGTARAGWDYRSTSGIASIRAGYTSKVVSVPIIKDRAVESDETFNLNLSNPENATAGDGTGVGTIRNDD